MIHILHVFGIALAAFGTTLVIIAALFNDAEGKTNSEKILRPALYISAFVGLVTFLLNL